MTEETLPKEVSSQKNGRYGMFMAIGNELPTEDGLEVELNGNLERRKILECSIRFLSFQIVLPTSTEGIKAYLASDIIKGIGPVLAERIVDRYQENTFEVLEKKILRSYWKSKALPEKSSQRFWKDTVAARLCGS